MKKLYLAILSVLFIHFGNAEGVGRIGTEYKDAHKIVQAYPDFHFKVDGNLLVASNGAKFLIDNQKQSSSHEDWLDNADIADMFTEEYIAGKPANKPELNSDPGRARCESLFEFMYGSSSEKVNKNLKTLYWVDGTKLKVTTVNGVYAKFENVVRDLKKLPISFMKYLKKPGGTFNWRVIAGTKRRSCHSYGIAIDINVSHSHYWRNVSANPDAKFEYKNSIPFEIVEIFERHGFVWGGKWYHYDTMHFEYRPELFIK